MSTSRTLHRPRRRRAAVALAAVVATVAVVGVVLALAPSSDPQLDGSGSARLHADSSPRALISGLGSSSGSLVGGEQQTLTGRGLGAVDEIRVGGTAVTDIVATDRSVTFAMPRAERYASGAVPVEVVSSTAPVIGGSELTYTYEVRTGIDRQMEYAFTHWLNYNLAEFGTFNPVGGDCVNFVSQTLLARGWEMTTSWHNYDGGAQWTGPWIHVPSFDTWLRNNPQYGAVRLTLDQRDQVKVGDLVVFDWNVNNSLDHIQIVSAVDEVDGRIEIKMVGHNLDSDYRDLDETMEVDHPGGIGYFWSLPAG